MSEGNQKNRKLPKHFYELNLGPYPVTAVYVPNERSWKRAEKQFKVKTGSRCEFPANNAAMCHIFQPDVVEGTTNMVIFVTIDIDNNNISPEMIAAICAHEATHVWQFMLEMIGEHNPSYEFEAYTIQSVTQDLLYSIKAYRKARSK